MWEEEEGKIEDLPYCHRLWVMNKMCEHHLALNRLPQTNGRMSSYCYRTYTFKPLQNPRASFNDDDDVDALKSSANIRIFVLPLLFSISPRYH